MKIRAFAKINLALDVVGEREDGYHELNMIMAPLMLHDLINIEIIDSGIQISTNSYKIPVDQRNIMYKVAQAVIDYYHLKQGVKIHCIKHIPSQAGLAGGSADGAAVIKAMNRLFNLRMSYNDMVSLTKSIGADIPFCIYNHLAVVTGIGEKFEFIDTYFNAYFLLVKPKKGVSTKRCFASLDMNKAVHPDINKLADCLRINDYWGVVSYLNNTLEEPSFKIVNDIKDIKDKMLELGFDGALMSGSGSCVFGITQSEDILEKGFSYFKGKYPFVRRTELLNS